MARNPNPEQLLAIEHQGGVLLKAGAGSGKTFVLVEHIVYLTSVWLKEFKESKHPNFEDHLRHKFSQVVMMTFTKKAAGEMSIRLNERFLEKSLELDEDQVFWKVAFDLLPFLTVTTIDGFCRKLITMGFFPHLSTEAKIIFDTERKDQVTGHVEEWFNKFSHNISQEVLDVLLREKRSLLASLTNVFSDPGLRLDWKKFDLNSIHPKNIEPIIEQSFKLNQLDLALFAIENLDIDIESERSEFEKLIASFQATGLPVINSVNNLKVYAKLFQSIKRLDGERSKNKKTPASMAAKEGLASLRDWIKTWHDVINDYHEHFEKKVLPWMKLCLDIFTYVESKLDPNQGMTFGDVEYQVSLGLDNQELRERIHRTFSYFIVDEFQDTSTIQFNIIKRLIGEDFKKLFCVGDAKQAIYGFRGGELSVFQNCANLVPKVRSLAKNYRSSPSIIKFNNSLFRTILPLGQNYSGSDLFLVSSEDQEIPDEIQSEYLGTINVLGFNLERDLESDGKFSNEEVNRLEAFALASAIKKERETTNHVCTVLYSRLKPSFELITALMNLNIGFTAQFKIDLMDEPILGMFVCLLRRTFNTDDKSKNRFSIFILNSYLNVLEIPNLVNEEHLHDFDQDVLYWGLVEAFRKFIFKLHITNENTDINFSTIEVIAQLYHQDQEAIMLQLLQGDNKNLSLDLRFGKESGFVQIMSSHASKGLEFDSVYLAGIYTNGRDQDDGAMFGDLPGSFNWFIDISQRIKQKSPFYVFEKELSKHKDFSETKRIFYVACTRAKKNLTWVDFNFPDKCFSIAKNSWILGLRAWQERSHEVNLLTQIQLDNFNPTEILKSKSTPRLPLFFHDSVGILSKGSGESELMLTSELSVTRLGSLLDCPRKFYYENVLKIKDAKNEISFSFEQDADESEIIVPISSARRGTQVHEQIAKGIEKNFIVPRESLNKEWFQALQWVLDDLRPLSEKFDLISERPIKFRFFNFMISGIPDLLLLPKLKEQAPGIWDFKTGKLSQDSLSRYWQQLSIYAYALYELKMVDKNQEVELVLSFVDEAKKVTRKTHWQQCRDELYPLWVAQNKPWKTNLDHCSQCSYGSICPR